MNEVKIYNEPPKETLERIAESITEASLPEVENSIEGPEFETIDFKDINFNDELPENTTESAIRQSRAQASIDEWNHQVTAAELGFLANVTARFPSAEGETSVDNSPVAATNNNTTITGSTSNPVPVNWGSGGQVYDNQATYTWGFNTPEAAVSKEDQDREILYREKAIEAACKAFGDRDVELTEFGTALDYFYNYIKYGTKLDIGK
jgi:hypothetical protein